MPAWVRRAGIDSRQLPAKSTFGRHRSRYDEVMPETASTTRVLQSGHRLTVCLPDCIDARSVSEIERQLLPQLSSTDGRPDVLFDLQAVRSFDLDVRAALVALHRTVAGRARRTVYLAARAHIRGLALWLIHFAEDPASSVAMNAAQAEAWLTQGKERVTWALQRTEQALANLTGSGKPQGGRP